MLLGRCSHEEATLLPTVSLLGRSEQDSRLDPRISRFETDPLQLSPKRNSGTTQHQPAGPLRCGSIQSQYFTHAQDKPEIRFVCIHVTEKIKPERASFPTAIGALECCVASVRIPGCPLSRRDGSTSRLGVWKGEVVGLVRFRNPSTRPATVP